MKNILFFTIKCFLLISLVAACGGKDKATKKQAQENRVKQADLTVPPTMVKRNQQVLESDPNETVSFEEWKKKQNDSDEQD